ncbi:hypothetical protein MMC17_008270 [Xylographa soralifera]|nr:hypothetical protein [Xylographa soralifera]
MAADVATADVRMAPQPTFEPLDNYTIPIAGPRTITKQIITETVQEIPSTSSTRTVPSLGAKTAPALYITGLGSQYPPFLFAPERLESFIKKWYDLETPGIKKLLAINQTTTIQNRSTIKSYDDPFWNRAVAPDIAELDVFFRKAGVDLAVQACKKAIKECGIAVGDITHVVAVTCTNAGNPGYDLLVAQKLGLRPETDRTLLHGVGCAGGLSAMRAAAAMAQSATLRRRAARVLVVAVEICSINVRCDLNEVVEHPEEAKISPVLFSDGAAAFVLCNELAPEAEDSAVYSVVDWANATIPDTSRELEFMADPLGFRATLTKEVPQIAMKAITPMFEKLLPSLTLDGKPTLGKAIQAKDFDWALHPGGIAILNGTQNTLDLQEDQLRASFEIYKTHGNSSSPTVLIVLDKLRRMGEGRENVVACSFGPGMAIEMFMLKRCYRKNDD